MIGEMFSTDNSGNRTPGHPHCADPIAASGITITVAVTGNDYTRTLVGGQMYAITFIGTLGKRILASATGLTSTAANIEWVFHAGYTHIFRMPEGKTTLYYEGDEVKSAYIRKLAD